MRTIVAARCVHRTPPKDPLQAFARRVVADPAAHHATEREARIIAALLAELVAR